MQALVFDGPWQMPLRDRPDPVAGPGEVVVAIRASGICGSDVHGYTGSTGRRTPGVTMGHEAAGEIVEIGSGVTSVRTGDRVALRSILPCGECRLCREGRRNVCANRRGLGMHLDGAYAERVVVPEALVLPLPHALPWEEAALIEPLGVAMHAVAVTPFQGDARITIVGAGTIGLLTLLAVRARGAGSVLITDRSPRRLALAERLGADVAIDAGADDVGQRVRDATDGAGADAVIEAVGISATVAQSIAAARTGGHVTWIGNSEPSVNVPMQDVVTREITIRGAYGADDEFAAAAEALAERHIDVRPLIEHRAPLADGPDLFRALAEGRMDAVKVLLLP
jgi:L-iditol 2-dehydrogenase